MAVIDYIDGPTRRIYLLDNVRSYHPVDDIYKEARALRRTDETLRKFVNFVDAGGAVSKGSGKYTPRYAVFMDGCKIVPQQDVSHNLEVTGEQITDAGGSGAACVDLTLLDSGVYVNVHYYPPTAELLEVEVGDTLGVGTDLSFMAAIEGGKQEVTDEDGGTLVCYNTDNTTEVARFALYDGDGGRTVDLGRMVKRVRL